MEIRVVRPKRFSEILAPSVGTVIPQVLQGQSTPAKTEMITQSKHYNQSVHTHIANEEGGSNGNLRKRPDIWWETGKRRSVDNTNLDRGGPKTYTEVRHWELAMSWNYLCPISANRSILAVSVEIKFMIWPALWSSRARLESRNDFLMIIPVTW